MDNEIREEVDFNKIEVDDSEYGDFLDESPML